MLLHEILEVGALQHPERAAVAQDQRIITYAELRNRSHRLANGLRAFASPGDRVAILAQNVPEYADALYGVPAAGMALVLLNYRLHPRELAWTLHDAGVRVLIVEQQYLPALMELRNEFPSVERVVVIGVPQGDRQMGYEALLAAASAEKPPAPSEDAIAWQLYTSGTTGRPKGAMLSHRNIFIASCNAVISYETRPDERVLQCFPLCHVAVMVVPYHHLIGACVVLARSFDPDRFLHLVASQGITSTAIAVTMLDSLLKHPKLDHYDLTTLRKIGAGSSILPVSLCRAAIERFGPVLYSGYGTTETAAIVLTQPMEGYARAARGEEHLLAACGKHTPLCAARVVDEEMKELPPGEVGEIVARGEQVMKSYWKRADADAEAFKGGWFHTGDLAYRDDEGFYYIVDRKKDMIVSGGENVYSREVEDAILAHPAVAEVAVIGLPDPKWVERVTAVAVLRPGRSASEREIQDACRSRLAGFKTPKQVLFVDELPKNSLGKVLKRDLRDRLGK